MTFTVVRSRLVVFQYAWKEISVLSLPSSWNTVNFDRAVVCHHHPYYCSVLYTFFGRYSDLPPKFIVLVMEVTYFSLLFVALFLSHCADENWYLRSCPIRINHFNTFPIVFGWSAVTPGNMLFQPGLRLVEKGGQPKQPRTVFPDRTRRNPTNQPNQKRFIQKEHSQRCRSLGIVK